MMVKMTITMTKMLKIMIMTMIDDDDAKRH